ncbi:MAG: heparinase, partial [Paenibacillus sp.]|nr:heparinase [Paenibacillus sp.]
MADSKRWDPPAEVVPDLTLVHPRVFYTREQVIRVRGLAAGEAPAWVGRISRTILERADSLRWMSMDDQVIRGLVPRAGSFYMYGVTNPVGPDGTRIHPIGWEMPGHVRSETGIVYPNATHPDDGTGWRAPDGQVYYFTARWNGFVVDELTRALEPLALAYTISGERTYARKAAVILDALASVYSQAIEGPLDYPGLEPGREGGRLERPYYQVARTLIWYVNACDLIWDSGELEHASPTNPGCTCLENITYNLLLNGADYCYREAQLPGYVDQLHNGTADYNLGILTVGSLFGIEAYVQWALNGPTNIRFMIANNLDRDGNYYETSELYSRHSQHLYLTIAEALFHVRTPVVKEGVNLFMENRFARFYVGNRRKNTIAGRIPAYGDSPVDEATNNRDVFDSGSWQQSLRFLVRASSAGKRAEYAESLALPAGVSLEEAFGNADEVWSLFNISNSDSVLHQLTAAASIGRSRSCSTVLGGKGLVFLRAGSGDQQRGAFLRYGPTLNHGHLDELGVLLYASGRELSFDPGYGMAHYRYGWQFQTVSHLTVTVNEKSQLSQDSAGGSLNFFVTVPGLSAADVSDEGAYAAEGVSVYQRMLAVIDVSESRSYWIDLFRVQGGLVRDYSFHGRGTTFLSQGLDWSPSESGSVESPQHNWGSQIKGDGKITGFEQEDFFFEPPGNGYGFLGHPRRAYPQQAWSCTWSNPSTIRLTMLPEKNRQVIAADGPEPMGGVAYVLARDSGEQPSRFVSVIEAGDESGFVLAEPMDILALDEYGQIEPVGIALSVQGIQDEKYRDYVLSTTDCSIFLARDRMAGGRELRTDAAFAMLRVDDQGSLLQAHLTNGTCLVAEELELRLEHSRYEGKIISVDYEQGSMLVQG